MSENATEEDVVRDEDSKKEVAKEGSVDSKADESKPEAKSEGKEDPEYPEGFAFAMIMTSVLSSLFLVALVVFTAALAADSQLTNGRTEQSSPPPFL